MAEERKAITVHVDLATHERIKAAAFVEGDSVAAVCRDALTKLFKSGKTIITPAKMEAIDNHVSIRVREPRGVNTVAKPMIITDAAEGEPEIR